MKTDLNFRQATKEDIKSIWDIIQFAIESRKQDGSSQWQDGYPHLGIIENDIQKRYGYVLTQNQEILFYAALISEKEPAYEAMKESWLTSHQPYAVIHRMAASPKAAGKGLSKIMMDCLENKALRSKFESIRIDTNFDNQAMLKILKKRDYIYCGTVYFRGSARKAFEKLLV
ncbi:GNAT family N-acetyltransferase [Flavobacteriaceae bacterium Ap0902]|nr:GNAT family N-acetyltransferase [Flavobacteriaceae bacterium Ap0902]